MYLAAAALALYMPNGHCMAAENKCSSPCRDVEVFLSFVEEVVWVDVVGEEVTGKRAIARERSVQERPNPYLLFL